MNEFVRSPNVDDVVTIQERNKITRNLKDGVLESKDRTKDFRIVYTKRVRIDNFDTVPYGF